MATVDEIKARIQEETGAFSDEVAALLDQLVAAVRGETPSSETVPAGVNEAQQDIIEPTPDPTPEDSDEPLTSSADASTSSAPPDTTGL